MAEGRPRGGNKRRVLFLCTGNSCRSQMAEGWLRTLAEDRFEAASAGTHPAGLNPGAVTAMREAGVDISGHQSKNLSEFLGQPFDFVITVCDRAKEACPVFPASASVLHWSFDDPAAGEGPDERCRAIFQRIRDEIRDRIRQWLSRQPA